VVLRATGQKEVLFDPRLMPRIALLDPDLTLDLPPHLTAATGMDAFTHCIESYVSPVFHPVADSIAVGGMELVIENLPKVVEDGRDANARGYMMIAAMMGALAFQKDLGAAHAMAHPLSTISGVHHGLANAVVLPYVMDFNLKVAQEKYSKVAGLFDPQALLLESQEAARTAIQAVRDLNRRIGIPSNLKSVGVLDEDLALLAEAASKDSCRLTNPCECGLRDFQALFHKAFEGK
jgi:alcohol dehydrogenase class IV